MPIAINIIDNTSPMDEYNPYYECLILKIRKPSLPPYIAIASPIYREAGWEIWYSGSGLDSATPVPTVSFDFYGSANAFYGTADCTFDVTRDILWRWMTTSPGGFGLQVVSLCPPLDLTGGSNPSSGGSSPGSTGTASTGQSGKSTNVGVIVGPAVAALGSLRLASSSHAASSPATTR
ncbi:hypothetical protein PAXRUDRAFT_7823 [Paxillus rubicundulus Ve08.2h10]|uniref:Uncharacterized protein n=1 Tax=Paxillus rubicundulus Ve08.2h10 TaxID=930991 RepID=A0A0D0DPM6_9AGAM|nr:hypothetical protein PAXRUDRAFT_7823 [Paxillus rubicundulus Ve08.2h10]